jgi:signal transduction histidine kinase
VHRLLAGLRPQLLEQVGLVAACHALLREFTHTSGIQHKLFVSHAELMLEENIAMAAYRIVQEGLTNIVRHAGAHLVRVSLVMQEERNLLLVRIADDGCGFDPGSVRKQHGYGLLGIRERAQLLGGRVQVNSTPKQGTELLVELPLYPQTSLD